LQGSYSVLHIEDDPSTLLLVSHALDIPNLSIRQVAEIELNKGIPDIKSDIILSDLMMNNQPIDSFLSSLKETSDIPLVVLSAFEPTRMKSITIYFLQKPFEIDELKNLVIMLLGRQEYDVPQLEAIYEQYDFQPEKIRNFLNILQQEFTDYLMRFEEVFGNKDENEWKAILHKLTTHIKSLKLNQLSMVIPDDLSQLDDKKVEFIRNSLLYCLCVFRHESNTSYNHQAN
jgi:DNA-binding response OmpR family regulator